MARAQVSPRVTIRWYPNEVTTPGNVLRRTLLPEALGPMIARETLIKCCLSTVSIDKVEPA